MNSLPQTMEGTSLVPGLEGHSSSGPSAVHPHSPGDPGGFRIRLMQASPLFVKSALLTPFREVLRPLARWLMRPHFAVRGEEPDSDPVDVNLKPPSLLAAALVVILGPLVFVMLLPLILILLPAFIIIGLAGVAAASWQFDHSRPVLAA